ncbi:MAG: class I SAM-dependent methyltransferase [Candidatus Omnitrophica bacterium]|nr:class I SAM-dependent methyltransferase [Candidatus Omnitrophota bacterium]
MNYKEIQQCRICKNRNLVSLFDLGEQALTGVFPNRRHVPITRGPLSLVKCMGKKNDDYCGLVQLKHSFDPYELYGDNYGYRSGLNKSMEYHLNEKVKTIVARALLKPGDLIIDIGSNDGTLLKAYPRKHYTLVGIDPTIEKFKKYYPSYIHCIPDFFSSRAVKREFKNKKAKVVTSIAMLYDLADPLDFMEQVREVLADDGIWVFQQSYLPSMLETTGYDVVCHEHLEYYALRQIAWMTKRAGLKLLDVRLSSINGGSFAVTVAKVKAPFVQDAVAITVLEQLEKEAALDTLAPYQRFKERVQRNRQELRHFVKKAQSKGEEILGYGASTKGNVILQYCGFTAKDIPFIAEVNEDKFGCFTPGTWIPIISEQEARKMRPDYFMVLPWHFKDSIIKKEKEFLKKGGKLFFPLPMPEVIGL